MRAWEKWNFNGIRGRSFSKIVRDACSRKNGILEEYGGSIVWTQGGSKNNTVVMWHDLLAPQILKNGILKEFFGISMEKSIKTYLARPTP